MQQAIAYYRVSTARQGRSGLGIEAQREAVTRFAATEGFDLTAEFVEVETGKGNDALDRRPRLAAALATGRQKKCPVIVAKLDRLSRDIARIQGQVEIGVRFVPLAVGAEDMRAAPKEPIAPSGTAYLMTKFAQVRDRERRCAAATEAAHAMHAILRRLATASRFDAATADRDWIAAAFLMPRDATETFRQAVCRLAKAHPDLALLCTGPWPPYSFVGAQAGEKAIAEDQHGYLH